MAESLAARRSEQTELAPRSADRRRDPRRALKTRVALKTERAIFFMESVDVSLRGIRLESEVAIEVGTRCRLVPFFDDVARLFEAAGTVVRVHESEGPTARECSRSQMGIQFENLSPAELEALLAILKTADPVPFPRVAGL